MSDAIRITCTCGHVLRLPTHAAGRKARCPHCKRIFEVPASAGEELPPLPESTLPAPRSDAEPVPPAPPAPEDTGTFAVMEPPTLPRPGVLALDETRQVSAPFEPAPQGKPPSAPRPPASAAPSSELSLEDEPLSPPSKRAPAPAAPAEPPAPAAKKPAAVAKPPIEPPPPEPKPVSRVAPVATASGHPACVGHHDREATRACIACKSFLCDECSNTHGGITLCETCLSMPERAKGPDIRMAQEALLRKRGVAVGDFTRAFRAQSALDALKFALNALTGDGRLLYMAFGVFFALGSLSGLVLHYCRKGDALNRPMVWGWLGILAVAQTLTFGGFVGTCRDMLFGLPFDIGRFVRQMILGLKVSWLTLPLFVMTGLLTGPNLWSASAEFIPLLKAAGILALSLTLAVPAVVAMIEKAGLGRGLLLGLRSLLRSVFSMIAFNILIAVVTWMWMYTTRMLNAQVADLPDLVGLGPLILTGLVVSMLYAVWIIGTASIHLSRVPPKEVASRTPPVGLPAPKAGITNIVVGVAVAAAIGCAAVASLRVPLANSGTKNRVVMQLGLQQFLPDFSKPAAPPAKGKPAKSPETKKGS